METNTKVTFQPVITKRASEIIYDQIREMIVSGEICPGDRLPSERNMIEMFQRSRPTIREALRMLERNGYIKINAGSHGAVVLAPDDKNLQQTMTDALQSGHISIQEVSEFRIISECAAVEWACIRRSDEDLRTIRALLDQMKALTSDSEAFINLDPEFHNLIANAAHNTISGIMNRTLRALNQQFVHEKFSLLDQKGRKSMANRIHQMHEEIYLAIANQDVETAKTAMKHHLEAFIYD